MNDIAGRLGITKALLYKHYASKQEILDRIVEQMNEMDYARAEEYGMPETEPDGCADKVPGAYKNAKNAPGFVKITGLKAGGRTQVDGCCGAVLILIAAAATPFGVAERLSVFAAAGFNVALGRHLFFTPSEP